MTEIAALGLRVDGVQNIDNASASLDKLTTSSAKAEKSTDGLADASKKSSRDVDTLAQSSKGASNSVDSLATVAKRAAGIFAAAFSVRQIQQYADAWSDLTSRVRVAIGPGQDAADVMRQLGEVARSTYSPLEATADSFARNAFTLSALGKTTQEQINFTSALNNALVVSGAKGQQFEMVQNSLNRAMANGSLRGLELQNVLNYGSEVASALADELGINVTQLREYATQGKITGDVIFNSMIKNQELFLERAESMPATIGDAFVLIRNAVLQTVGVFDQQNTVSEKLAGALIVVADNMRVVAALIASATAGWITYQIAVNGAAIALSAATAAQRLFNAAAMANPYVAAATAVAALSVALYGLRNETIGAGEDAAQLGDYFSVTWDRIKDASSGAVDYISGLWGDLKNSSGGIVDDVYASFAWLWGELKISAHVTVNDLTAIGVSIGETFVIVAKRIYDDFKDSFTRISSLATAFGRGVAGVFRGDFGFDAFRKALNQKVENPATTAAEEIAAAWKKNLGKDWLGDGVASVVKFGREISAAAKNSRNLNNDLDDLIKNSGLFAGVIESASGSVSGLNDDLKDLENQLQTLVDKYDKLGSAQRTAVRELAGLQRAAAMGLPGAEAAIDGFYESLMIAGDALKRASKSTEEFTAQANPLSDSWQAALERVDSAFVDLWKSAFNGFKDFADSLKNAFIQLLAELAHRATTQKILVSLGFTAGSGTAMAGGASGAGGGLLGVGQSALGGMLSSVFGPSGFAGTVLRAMRDFSAPIAAIAGAIQGWQSGNRANAVTGALGGWGGAKAGAAAGTYILPGIGTAIGAVLGGILGSSLGSSVFGGGWENRRSGIQLGFDEEGLLLEDWIRQTKKGGLFGSTKRRYRYSEMEEAMAAEFRTGYDTMIDVLGTQFLAIGADLDRAVFEGVKIGSASINTSDQTEEQVQEQIEKWFNDLQEAMIKGALKAAGDASAAVRLLAASGGGSELLGALGGMLGVAGINAVQMARDAQVQMSMSEGYQAVADATRALIGEYDGSLEATLGLTEAMAVQQEVAFNLASAFLQASDAVGALFGNLSESIRQSLMGAEELYEYQRGQVHSLTDLLGTLSDPEAILRTSQEIERLVSGMWGSLDGDQRGILGEEFLEYLDRTEALAQDRLAQGLADLESTQSDIYSALTEQMNTVADQMIEATNRMEQAAALQFTSAEQFAAYVAQFGYVVGNMGIGREVNA